VAERVLALQRDRTLKQRIYAKAGVPVYWILNLSDRQLEVFTQPNIPKEIYEQNLIFREGESVKITLKGEEIGAILVNDLL